MLRATQASLVLVFALALSSCGGAGGGGAVTGGEPRPGGAINLMSLVPGSAVVVLHADMNAVRSSPEMYNSIAGELISELQLSGDATTVRALLDLTDDALGAFVPAADGTHNEGMLVFAGRYSGSDFQSALSVAAARHGSTPPGSAGASGQVYELGDATMAQLDQWTWAIAQGPQLRAHLREVALGGGGSFGRDLLEFGPRIGLPRGSAQAWANQDHQVGIDMVGLVFQGQNPQMVHNFVNTVSGHLGL